MNQAYSRLSTTHGHITDCKLEQIWSNLDPVVCNVLLEFSQYTCYKMSYAPFSEKCTKWPNMALQWPRSKRPICILHTPQRLKLYPVSLYDEPFLGCKPILRKVHQMTPKWPWHVQGWKCPYAYNIHPRGPNSHLFHSMIAILTYDPILWKMHSMAPNWPWHVQG